VQTHVGDGASEILFMYFGHLPANENSGIGYKGLKFIKQLVNAEGGLVEDDERLHGAELFESGFFSLFFVGGGIRRRKKLLVGRGQTEMAAESAEGPGMGTALSPFSLRAARML